MVFFLIKTLISNLVWTMHFLINLHQVLNVKRLESQIIEIFGSKKTKKPEQQDSQKA
jgi:hypothetical protein